MEEESTTKAMTPVDIPVQENETCVDFSNIAALFPSIRASIESTNIPILALYFAAAWCPDCQNSAPFVSEVFKSQNEDSKLFDLIYVSSDQDAEQMTQNLDDGWGAIPFENEEERANIKRYYGACAAKELESLGMKPEDRKSGIPTLILVEKKSGNTLLADVVPDIMGDSKVEDPLGKWKSMLYPVRD
jgi:nucleoredoxin